MSFRQPSGGLFAVFAIFAIASVAEGKRAFLGVLAHVCRTLVLDYQMRKRSVIRDVFGGAGGN